MKTKNKKLLIIAVCAFLLVAVSVVGTLAYFSAKDTVTNTFTVGKIAITLDEAKVDDGGVPAVPAERVKTNEYKLSPSHVYTKDPIVHVDKDSENSWVFIKVTNGIASVEDSANNIDSQILGNNWTALSGKSGVYYQEYTKGQADKELETFSQFKIANSATAKDLEPLSEANLSVFAYAIQKDNLMSAEDAWAALSE